MAHGMTSLKYSAWVTGCHIYLVFMATVLGAQDKSWQVTRQVEPSEVPNKVPEDNGMLVNNAWGGDCLVALIHQQALQLLPQNQRAQVGHCYRSRSRGAGGGGGRGWGWDSASTPTALPLLCRSCRWLSCTVCCGDFFLGIGWQGCILLFNRIAFLRRPDERQRVDLFKWATGIKDVLSVSVCLSALCKKKVFQTTSKIL